MWLLFHHERGAKVVAGGRTFVEHCPTCERHTRFREIEITERAGIWFLNLDDDKRRGFRCDVCEDVFDLREQDSAPPPRGRAGRAEEANGTLIDDNFEKVRGLALVIVLTGCDQLLGLTQLRPVDAGRAARFVAAYTGTNLDATQSEIDIPIGIDAPADYCIVSIGLAAENTTPSIASVSYGNMAMTPIGGVQDIPGFPEAGPTSSLQYGLASPSFNAGDLVILLASPGNSIHVSAMFFTGVNQTSPVRDFETSTGHAIGSTVTVNSEIGDLVESVTGQGNFVDGTAGVPPIVFVDNTASDTTLDNAAGLVVSGMSPTTIVAWSYRDVDYFETMAASLEPAP